jgi:putative membrane protein
MMWYSGDGTHWWGWLIGALVMVAFWGVIVWAIWYFVTGVSRQSQTPPRHDEAKRILDERLARGEIDAEEYQRLRELIRSDQGRVTNGQASARTGGER